MFLADFLGVDLHWATVVLLGLCVWLIYTFDHLNDARNIPHEASTERHRFHQKHFKWLTALCIFVLLLSAFFLFMIPPVTVVWGVALSCLVLGYFLLLYLLKLKSSYHKEITIAMLYSAGILLPSLSLYNGHIGWNVLVIFIQFVLLAFTNLVTFSVYEIDSDERDYSPSLARIFGEQFTRILLSVIVVVQVLLCVVLLLINYFFLLESVLFVMVTLMGSIVFFKQFYIRASLYRIVGDAVFLLPLSALLIS